MVDLDTIVQSVPDKQKAAYTKALQGKVPRSKAIALKCYDCCGWQRTQAGPDGDSIDLIKECAVRACPLWAYRPGSKLAKKRSGPKMTPEHQQKLLSGHCS